MGKRISEQNPRVQAKACLNQEPSDETTQAVQRAFTYVFLSLSCFIMAYPILFMVLGAFTTNDQFLNVTILSIPNTLNLEMIKRALGGGVWEAYIFTFQRVAFYVVVNVAVGLVGGYIFSKLRFPGRNKVFLLFLSGMVMPGILMIVPQYLLAAWFPLVGGNNIVGQGGHGFIGDWPVLFIYGWVPPFAIFLLKQSFDMLPDEYQDAAKMDGAGLFTIVFRVYGPLLRPSIVALVTLTFLGVWNDYLWPSLTISGHPQWYPITLRIRDVVLSYYSSVSTAAYPAVLMRTVLVVWPPALVYLLQQRDLVQGVVASGLKG